MSASEVPEEKNKKAAIEALLFATRGLTLEDISKRTGILKKEARQILEELEMEYLDSNRGMAVVKDGEIWKMAVKHEHTPDVRDLLPPEMPGAMTKTLAVIAAKKPVKQSLIIKIRGNKAYQHIKKLEKQGFIIREKHGNTQMIELTQKFFDYFQVVESELKKKFPPENAIDANE